MEFDFFVGLLLAYFAFTWIRRSLQPQPGKQSTPVPRQAQREPERSNAPSPVIKDATFEDLPEE